MANPWIDFVKEFRKKLPKDTPYKEVLKKAKVEYAKTKKDKPKAGTKGAKSKTHKGDLDFTTKKGDKDFHRKQKGKKEEKESVKPFQDTSLLQETARKLMADEAAKKGRAKAEVEKKFLEAGGTKDELKRELLKKQAVDLHSLVGGALLGGDPNTFTPMGGALNSTKDERAKLVRKYSKAKSLVMEFLRKGQLNQKEFNNFRALTKILSKSKTDKYAKDFAKVKKEFNSKKYEKLMSKKMEEKSVRDTKKLDTQLSQIMKILDGIRAARPLFSETAFKSGKKVEATAPLDITRKVEREDPKVRKGAVLSGRTAHKRDAIVLNAQGDLKERPLREIASFQEQFGLDNIPYSVMEAKFDERSPAQLLELQRNLNYLLRIPEDLLSQNPVIRDALANQILQVRDDLDSWASSTEDAGVTVGRDGQLRLAKQKRGVGQVRKGDLVTVRQIGKSPAPSLSSLSSHDTHFGSVGGLHTIDEEDDDIPQDFYDEATATIMGNDDPLNASREQILEINNLAKHLYLSDIESASVFSEGVSPSVRGATPNEVNQETQQELNEHALLLARPDQRAYLSRFYSTKVNPKLVGFFGQEVKNPNNTVSEVAFWLKNHLQDNGFVDRDGKYYRFNQADYDFLQSEIEKPQYREILSTLPAGSLPSDQEVREAAEVASLQRATDEISAEEAAAQAAAGLPPTPVDDVRYKGALYALFNVFQNAFKSPIALGNLTKINGRRIGQFNRALKNVFLGGADFTQDDYGRVANYLGEMGIAPALYQGEINILKTFPNQAQRPTLNDQYTRDELQSISINKRQILNDQQAAQAAARALPPPTHEGDDDEFQPTQYLSPDEQTDLAVYQRAVTDGDTAAQSTLESKYAGNEKMSEEFTMTHEQQGSTEPPPPNLVLSVGDLPPQPRPPTTDLERQVAGLSPPPQFADETSDVGAESSSAASSPETVGADFSPPTQTFAQKVKSALGRRSAKVAPAPASPTPSPIDQPPTPPPPAEFAKQITPPPDATVVKPKRVLPAKPVSQTGLTEAEKKDPEIAKLLAEGNVKGAELIASYKRKNPPNVPTPADTKAAASAAAPPQAGSKDVVVKGSQEQRFNNLFNKFFSLKGSEQTLERANALLKSIAGLDPKNKDLLKSLKHMDNMIQTSLNPKTAFPKEFTETEATFDSIGVSPQNLKILAAIYAALASNKLKFGDLTLDLGDLTGLAGDAGNEEAARFQIKRLLDVREMPNEKLKDFMDFVLGTRKLVKKNKLTKDIDLNTLLGHRGLEKIPDADKSVVNKYISEAFEHQEKLKRKIDETKKGSAEQVEALIQQLQNAKSDLESAFPHLFAAQHGDGVPTGAGFGDFLTKMKNKALDMYNSAKDRVTQEIGDASKLGHQIATGVQKVYGSNVNEVHRVNDNDQVFASMANNVYETQRQSYGDNHYVPNISSPSIAVWMNQPNKVITIAFRGTSNVGDVGTDASLAIGNLENTQRFQQDKATVEKLRAEFPNYSFNYTGHWLGGTIASLMLKQVGGNRAVVFNAGYGVNMGNLKSQNITSYQTEGDAVSMLGTGRYKDNYIIKNPHLDQNKSALTAHSMSNFNPSGAGFNFGDLMSGMATGDFSKAIKDGMGSAAASGGALLGSNPATYSPTIMTGAGIDASQGGKSTDNCKNMFMEGDVSGGSFQHADIKTKLRHIDELIEHLQDTDSAEAFILNKGEIKTNLHQAQRLLHGVGGNDAKKYGEDLRNLANDYNTVVRGRQHLVAPQTIQTKLNRTDHEVNGGTLLMNNVHPQVKEKLAKGHPLTFQEHEHIKRMTGHYVNEFSGGGMGAFWQSPAAANAVSINLSGRDLTGAKVGGAFGSMDSNISGFKQMIGQQSGNPLDYLPY